ncbi:MAG: hypothetical protein L0J85_11635, partial [Tetragenococcus koreensis]|nr:hypothetical protein [Tetragenococcus koreensis]
CVLFVHPEGAEIGTLEKRSCQGLNGPWKNLKIIQELLLLQWWKKYYRKEGLDGKSFYCRKRSKPHWIRYFTYGG